MSVVAGDVASAMPAPMGRMPASTTQYDESEPSWASTTVPSAMRSSPAIASGRRLTLSMRCGTRRERPPRTIAMGMSASPAWRGE